MSAPSLDYLCKVPMACRPAWVIYRRLMRDCLAGQRLAGMKFDRVLRLDIDTSDKLPCVRPRAFLDTEEVFGPGNGNRGSGSNAPTGTTPQEILLELSCNPDHGMVNMTPGAAGSKKGALEWLMLLKDSIELNDDGLPDPFLHGSSPRPIKVEVVETEVVQSSVVFTIKVTANVVGFQAANRSQSDLS